MSVDGITGPKKVDSVHLSSADCDRWEKMVAKHGMYGVAKKMMKTKAYRAYEQKYSFDYSQTWDEMTGSEEQLGMIPDSSPDIVELVDIRMRRQKLVDSLSAKQKAIWDMYEDGRTPAEIKEKLGYNTTEAIRWQKHNIKKKWLEVRGEE